MNAEELKALAQELGIELTEADAANGDGLQEEELEAVTGAGIACNVVGGSYCTCFDLGYGTTDGGDYGAKLCHCIADGIGTTCGPDPARGGGVVCQCAMWGAGSSD